MKISHAPDRCYAILVGIERYSNLDTWTLRGPASDALRFASWLLERKVPSANVRLFLSMAEPKDTDAKLARQKLIDTIAYAGITVEDPHQIKLDNVLTQPAGIDKPWLTEGETGALIVFWSGHGLVGDEDNNRILYTSDATEKQPLAIDLSAHMKRLGRASELAQLNEQWLIIDACAQWISTTTHIPKVLTVPGVKDSAHFAKQYAMFATEAGQLARNNPDRQTGIFTQELLRMLRLSTVPLTDVWPDLSAVVPGLVDIFKKDTQRPTIWLRDPAGAENVHFSGPTLSDKARQLSTIVAHAQAIPLGLQQQVFRRVAPPDLPLPRSAAEAVEHLDHCVEKDSKGWLDPLDKFALHLEVASGYPEVKRRAKSAHQSKDLARVRLTISSWLGKYVEAPVLEAMRQELKQKPSKVAYLIIDIPGEGADKHVRAWLYGTRPEPVSRPAQDHAGDLPKALGNVLDWALRERAGKDLIIELRVPHQLLCSGIDRKQVSLSADENEMFNTRTLGTDYVTFLRFRNRATNPLFAQEWNLLWSKIRAVLAQQHIASIFWAPRPATRSGANIPLGSHAWLGLDFVPSGEPAREQVLAYALSRGAPLIVWPTKDPVPGQEVNFQQTVAAVLQGTDLEGLGTSLRKALEKGALDFRLLVDVPDRFPDDPARILRRQLSQPLQRGST